MNITTKTKICIIIGDPVEHSLSPQMHNAAYEALNIDHEFIFMASRVPVKDVGKAVEAVKTLGIRGLTCTIPHKIEVMKYLDKKNIDKVAQTIGAVNTVVNNNGILKGYNTDWLGVLTPLEKITSLKNKNAAVIGAGGAARAMVYALTAKGAKLTVYNRTLEKAEELAEEFGGEAKPLTQLETIINSDIILNATSIGMAPDTDKSPLPKKYITKSQIIFDAIYSPYETRLLKDAKEKGAKIIHGTEMLLHQGTAQFELYTGRKAPVEVMRKVLLNNI